MLSELTRHFQRQPLISRTSTDPASSRADDVRLGPWVRGCSLCVVPNVRRPRVDDSVPTNRTRPHTGVAVGDF